MRLLIGTSGLGGSDWKGTFYPKELEEADMLGYYALRLRTLELGRTFYRMPGGEALQRMASATPTDFVFTLKASRDVTHVKRFEDVGERVKELYSKAQLLGHKLGPILFTCPSKLKKDLPRLERFLATLPAGAKAAVEFKSRSWHDDEVYATLEKNGVALCVSDHEDPSRTTPLVRTARFAYVRLRSASYSDDALESWVDRILAGDWEDAFVFFTQDRNGAAAKLALRMLEHAEANVAVTLPEVRSRPKVTALKPLAKIAPADGERPHAKEPRRRNKPLARTGQGTRPTRSKSKRGWRGGAPR